MHRKLIIGVFFLGVFFSCSSPQDKPKNQPLTVPEAADTLKKLTIYSLSTHADTVLLTKDQTFGDTDEVYFARLNEFTVDDEGRVYVADGSWGSRSLHVYNPDGSYLMKLAGEGRGPGEFLSISNLQSHSNRLLFYDSQLQRILMYSTISLELVKTALTDPQKLNSSSSKSALLAHEYYATSGENIIAAFEETPQVDNSGKREKQYYRLNSDLKIVSEKLTELGAKSLFIQIKYAP